MSDDVIDLLGDDEKAFALVLDDDDSSSDNISTDSKGDRIE